MALGVLILLVSAGCFVMAVYLWSTTRERRGWPTVYGRILERGVGGRMPGDGRYYLPHVKYTYAVDGQEFVCEQVYAVGLVGDRPAGIHRLVDGLPDPLPVHYNPADPAQAYLLDTPRWPVPVLFVFGAGAFLWGVVQLLIALVPV